ncbi:MAG TPA: hypothetical protein PKD53_22295, partial [Chloroflexaceae bacterium]|nr:hypothetical protein [Chloroflexaceae bacterium]
LYGATLDRVYRCALLVAGSPRAAARLTRAAYGGLPAPASEAALASALLARPVLAWPWRPDPAAAAYAGLGPVELGALRAAFAAAAPGARLALGAPHVAAIDIGEAPTPPAPAPDAPWPRRAGDRHALLALVARAWGLLPEGAGYADVYEQVLLRAGALPEAQADALRALLLADTPAAQHSRAVREGLRRAEVSLAAALPALFGGEAPEELRAGLARGAGPRRRLPTVAAARLPLVAVAVVAAIALAVIALPRGRPAASAALATTQDGAAVEPAALVQAALARLDSPAGAGVRHERFVATTPGSGWSLERWQELSPPHRFRVEVRDGQDRLRFALASDGAGLVQQRLARPDGTLIHNADYELAPEELGALLPTLRQQPDSLILIGGQNPGFNLERYYLNQALDAPLRDLGATLAAGRPARLLAFESQAPVPPTPDNTFAAAEAPPAQVLLALDAETRALLEARVLPSSAETAGEVSRPWRAEVFELLPRADADTFRLPPAGRAADEELVSARLLGVPPGVAVALSAATAPPGAPLYFPTDGAGEGYGLRFDPNDRWTVLVRETADEVVQLIPFGDGEASFADGRRSPRQAGDRPYELIYPESMPPGRNVSLATVFLGPDRSSGMHLIYSHAYAPRHEREARLEALIESLAPLEVGG